jgi:hypothetical protein
MLYRGVNYGVTLNNLALLPYHYRAHLYIGNLSPRVNEPMLGEIL